MTRVRKKQLSPQVERYVRQVASMGGKARARKTTPEQRQEWARKAARTRWEKQQKAKGD